MEHLILKIKISDVELSIEQVEAALLRLHKMPKVFDPSWVDPDDGSKAPLIDKFLSVEALIENFLGTELVKVINNGFAALERDGSQVLTKDSITTGE